MSGSCVGVAGNISPPLCKIKSSTGKTILDKFQVITEFPKTDSDYIIDILAGIVRDKEIIFTQDGSIGILKDNKIEKEYLNRMTESSKVFTNDTKIKMQTTTISETFISSTGLWILYVDIKKNDDKTYSKQLYLLYNPIHREDYKNYFLNSRYTALKIFNTYCDTIGNKDNACYCIPSSDTNDHNRCVKKLYNDEAVRSLAMRSSPNGYAVTANNCPCYLSECGKARTSVASTSFIRNPVMRGTGDIPSDGLWGLDNCANRNVSFSICSQSFEVGGNLNAGDMDLSQTCGGGSSDTPTAPAATTAPEATAPSANAPSANAPATAPATAPLTPAPKGGLSAEVSLGPLGTLPMWLLILIILVMMIACGASSYMAFKKKS